MQWPTIFFSLRELLDLMSDFNTDLYKALNILYDHSNDFKLSIDIIQQLSQQLKLDTFIDTDAYSHIIDQPLTDEHGNTIKFQRLSIAGSLILIDVDFVDSTIHRVSFSLANLLDENEIGPKGINDTKKVPTILDQENIKIIKLNFNSEFNDSILNKCPSNNIELILLQSLSYEKLLNFPINLKFLAKLDRLSKSKMDAFTYLDNIGLILQSIYEIEKSACLQDDEKKWAITEGFYATVGKVSINKPECNKLGIFIDFWEDFLYLNKLYKSEYEKDEPLVGKKYNILLDIDEASHKTPTDYISESRDHVWPLNNERYQIQFTDNSHLASRKNSGTNSLSSKELSSIVFSANWILKMVLSTPIFLPINILEFIGVNDFEELFDENILYEKLNNEKEIIFTTSSEKAPEKVMVQSGIHSKFISVKSLTIKKISDIPLFIKVFRNHLLLTNILNQLECNDFKVGEKTNEITDDSANIKLKNSLLLLNLDNQVLNLQALSNDSMRTDEELDLQEFMKETSPDDHLYDESLIVKINDISYSSPDFNISLSITGKFNAHDLNINFIIANGRILNLKADVDEMEDDQTIMSERFIKCLTVTEDIVKSLQHVYK